MCKLVIRKYSVAFIWSLTFFLVVDGVCVCGTNSQPHIVCCRNRIIETKVAAWYGSGYCLERTMWLSPRRALA